MKTKIFSTVAEQVRQDEAKRSEEIEAGFPHAELEEKHIQNLQVFIDRDALLNVLPKQAIVAEVGVAQGNFSEKILSIAQPKELHLIDLWASKRYSSLRKTVENRLKYGVELGQVFFHQGSSTEELARFDDGYFGWVYIDTSHDYETTADELKICRNKVKRGGLIAGHDYVTGNWLSKHRYGVIEAVNEFCVKYDWEMVYLTHESHRHLSFAVKQIF